MLLDPIFGFCGSHNKLLHAGWFIFFYFLLFFKDFIYLFMRDTEREGEAETQAEGEAGSMQGARCGIRSWVSRSRPGPKAGAKPLRHPGIPTLFF